MKGFCIKIQLHGIFPEISRDLILPEKTTLPQFTKIIKKLFTFDDEGAFEFWLSPEYHGYIPEKNFLIEKYIHQKIYFTYDCQDRLWYEITLNRVIDYDENHATIIDYMGEFNLEKAQKDLNNIKILKNGAYDIIISCEKSKKTLKREFLIPEKTTFNQLEEIILVAFDTKPVSFKKDDVLVDDCFKKKSKIYSENRELSITVKKKIYSDKSFPILMDYKGGLDPFELWWEYYPEIPADENQCTLDDY